MGMATAPALYKKLPFDPLKDFEYVGQVLDVPMTLLARKDMPANTLPELLAYIKANKDKGTGPAMNELLGGQVDMLCDQTTQTVSMIKEGRVRVYGVTTTKRLPRLFCPATFGWLFLALYS